MKRKETFTPPWLEIPPAPETYRSIMKWGDVNYFKHPNHHLYELLKETLNLTDDDFQAPFNTGEEHVLVKQQSNISEDELVELRFIVGSENVDASETARANHCYGKSMLDLLRLRSGIIENPPDVVVYPRNTDEVTRIINLCNERNIAIVVHGGGSSVTSGLESVCGGISLDMRRHMNRIIEVDPLKQIVTVQPGILGPDLEATLNHSQECFNTPFDYTCGHFPQSFEFSTVGGWILTRGAGQNSTYYGKIEDLVLSQKYVHPTGEISTLDIPAKAIGPDIDQVMIGSEGAFGILVEVTLKIFRFQPANRKRFGFIFKDWDSSIEACREIMQGEFGFPSLLRLSDPEETEVAFKLYGVENTPLDWLLNKQGFQNKSRCLLLGHTEGDKDFGRLVHRKIRRICKNNGAFYTTGYVVKRWEHGRFTDPYLRDALGDFGIIIDTLECGVNWSNIQEVYSGVRKYCHSRTNTVCMTHLSHFYPQGANLYFIFIFKMESISDYLNYQAGFLDTIIRRGASVSHHHGIGKMFAPWLKKQIGNNQLDLLKVIKHQLDPNNILNPGGTLALDLLEDS